MYTLFFHLIMNYTDIDHEDFWLFLNSLPNKRLKPY